MPDNQPAVPLAHSKLGGAVERLICKLAHSSLEGVLERLIREMPHSNLKEIVERLVGKMALPAYLKHLAAGIVWVEKCCW